MKYSGFLRKFDLYGQGIFFYVNNKKKVKSNFGGFTSICIFATLFYLVLSSLIQWQNNDNLQIVSSTDNFKVQKMYRENIASSFDFNYENYNIYFAMGIAFPNGTLIGPNQMNKYFNLEFLYVDSNNVYHKAASELCKHSKEAIFLSEPFDESLDEISEWNLCISNNFTMGLFGDSKLQIINNTILSFQVLKCHEDEINTNISCATDEELEEILPFLIIQAFIPKTSYDFRNPANPRKRNYDVKSFHLDLALTKWYTGFLYPIFLKTDVGIFNENYLLNSVDFNEDQTQSEILLRKQKNNVLFQYDLYFCLKTQTYFRKNQKIYEILGNFGGVLNLLIYLGHFICSYYNIYLLKYEVIKAAFEKTDRERLIF